MVIVNAYDSQLQMCKMPLLSLLVYMLGLFLFRLWVPS